MFRTSGVSRIENLIVRGKKLHVQSKKFCIRGKQIFDLEYVSNVFDRSLNLVKIKNFKPNYPSRVCAVKWFRTHPKKIPNMFRTSITNEANINNQKYFLYFYFIQFLKRFSIRYLVIHFFGNYNFLLVGYFYLINTIF